jgi:hypothetical protein
LQKYFSYISIIIKQTFCQNLRVSSAIVLVLFKILNCCNSIFMSNILFCHGYTTKYVIMNGIKKLKKLKKLIYTNNCMGNCKISKIGDIWIKSDFRLICGHVFVTGNYNKAENEILTFIRTRQRTDFALSDQAICLENIMTRGPIFVTFFKIVSKIILNLFILSVFCLFWSQFLKNRKFYGKII